MKLITMAWRGLMLGLVSVLFVSCAVQHQPLSAAMVPTETPETKWVLQEKVRLKVSGAESVTLRAGTEWRVVGSIPQGAVCRSRDQVVVLNSFNVHEGFIVIDDNQVIGCYIPATKTFVKSKPVNATIVEKETDHEN